jgi:hypothetical protein
MKCTIEFPVEVNQKVWLVRNSKIEETFVEKLIFKDNNTFMKLFCNAMYETSCRSIGKTVFLSLEEAEECLKSK